MSIYKLSHPRGSPKNCQAILPATRTKHSLSQMHLNFRKQLKWNYGGQISSGSPRHFKPHAETHINLLKTL